MLFETASFAPMYLPRSSLKTTTNISVFPKEAIFLSSKLWNTQITPFFVLVYVLNLGH